MQTSKLCSFSHFRWSNTQPGKAGEASKNAKSGKFPRLLLSLVELIYGIDELGCVNDGEIPLKEVAAYFYKMLGVNAKECYHIYADMKMRKNESRTYFLDRMQERVNRRMEQDEERERMRR